MTINNSLELKHADIGARTRLYFKKRWKKNVILPQNPKSFPEKNIVLMDLQL